MIEVEGNRLHKVTLNDIRDQGWSLEEVIVFGLRHRAILVFYRRIDEGFEQLNVEVYRDQIVAWTSFDNPTGLDAHKVASITYNTPLEMVSGSYPTFQLTLPYILVKKDILLTSIKDLIFEQNPKIKERKAYRFYFKKEPKQFTLLKRILDYGRRI